MSSFPPDTPIILSPMPEKVPDTPLTEPSSPTGAFDASKDARKLVRLIQCPKCSHPLREPVTLPCGISLCKECVPEPHLRANISYPATANRLQGFTCPFSACRKDHALGDCGVDVTLNKILESVKQEVDSYRNTSTVSQVVLHVAERDKWAIAGLSSLRDGEPRVGTFPGGLLVATYTMAEEGLLSYDSEVEYTATGASIESQESLNAAVLEHIKAAVRSELDCQVCYGLFLDPLTATCGHTYCRKCVHRLLDHSNLCPICRRVMSVAPGVSVRQATSNVLLSRLISGFWPEDRAAREESAKLEEMNALGELDTPLFICALSFPHTPTFLHIFEPRYRLMIRRAIESGNRKFGMLLSNPTGEPQGNLGRTHYLQYGTLLHIVNIHLMPDGRSLIETVGVSRFRVLAHGTLDGYTVGKIERLDDISLAEEEAFEAFEVSSALSSTQDHSAVPPISSGLIEPLLTPDFDTMSTQDLMKLATSFVKKMREESAPWLHRRVFAAYGEPPDDPALFPWWFASVLPMADSEKYKLLITNSVRERLKMCAGWIAELEAQRWSHGSNCTVV